MQKIEGAYLSIGKCAFYDISAKGWPFETVKRITIRHAEVCGTAEFEAFFLGPDGNNFRSLVCFVPLFLNEDIDCHSDDSNYDND